MKIKYTLFFFIGLIYSDTVQTLENCPNLINVNSHGHIGYFSNCSQDITIVPIGNDPVTIDGEFMTTGNIRILPGQASVKIVYSHSQNSTNNNLLAHGETHIGPPPSLFEERMSFKDFEESINIKLSPNPTKNTVNIEANQNIRTIKIFDFNGLLLKDMVYKLGRQKIKLDLTTYKNGTYLLKIKLEDGNLVTKRVVKQ